MNFLRRWGLFNRRGAARVNRTGSFRRKGDWLGDERRHHEEWR